MYAKIKELADEAIALQNKDRMDAVLREISELCAYEGIADARKEQVVGFIERTGAAAIKIIEDDPNPLAGGKAVDYSAPAENPVVLDGGLTEADAPYMGAMVAELLEAGIPAAAPAKAAKPAKRAAKK